MRFYYCIELLVWFVESNVDLSMVEGGIADPRTRKPNCMAPLQRYVYFAGKGSRDICVAQQGDIQVSWQEFFFSFTNMR